MCLAAGGEASVGGGSGSGSGCGVKIIFGFGLFLVGSDRGVGGEGSGRVGGGVGSIRARGIGFLGGGEEATLEDHFLGFEGLDGSPSMSAGPLRVTCLNFEDGKKRKF